MTPLFIIFLTCYITVPSFIYNLRWVLLLRNHLKWKASLPAQKENWAFFWTFSFHFLSFNGAFLNLKRRTLVLKSLKTKASTILLKMDFLHKVSKYGKSEYSRALNASYTFQPLMSFCFDLIWLISITECSIRYVRFKGLEFLDITDKQIWKKVRQTRNKNIAHAQNCVRDTKRNKMWTYRTQILKPPRRKGRFGQANIRVHSINGKLH